MLDRRVKVVDHQTTGTAPETGEGVFQTAQKTLCRLPKGRLLSLAPEDAAALEALLPDRWVATHPEQREEDSREAQVRRRRKRAVLRIAAQ